jgi:gamma-glutamyltranspeptidase/glutathione hydrolase
MKNRLFTFALLGVFASSCASEKKAPVFVPIPHPSAFVDTMAGDTSAFNAGSSSKIPMGDVGSDRSSRVRPVIGTKGMVVSDDRQASEWGASILRRGGNAIDAAVAVGFMLSVTRPQYGSLGGGGFLVYCPAHKPCVSLDYRERAPAAATRDMYVKDGKANTDLSQNGAMASGIPGVPAGLLNALEKYGTRGRGELLSEPIQVAKNGFRFTGLQESAAQVRWQHINSAGKSVLGCAENKKLEPCTVGKVIRQPDLAHVLEAISQKGRDGFYKGWVAKKIVEGIQAEKGLLSLKDLEGYQTVVGVPVETSFQDMEVISMPPPSSGGVALLQMLGYMNRAENAGRLKEGFGSASTLHVEAHAMSLAFADRAEYMGDADFVKVPLTELLSDKYLDSRWATFNPLQANPPVSAGKLTNESQNTTHFSVIDKDGNAVAITTTINEEYGSGFVPPGTGIFMNNEMDDFSAQPGVPNLFGLVGGEANAIAPGKHPLSSMTPTIVRDHRGEARLILGAAGGPRIITSVFNVLMDRYIFGMSLPDAVAAPRIHDQWKPDEIRVETYGFAPDVLRTLQQMGYKVERSPALAKMHALERFPNGRTWGVADPRGEGAAVAE